MKVSISYPPLESEKGIPLLTQNRQFQWFSDPTYIYPMVPAYAASLLKEKGFDVIWDDAIAKNLKYDVWLTNLLKSQPDLIVIETKTPVVKRHWKIIDDIKSKLNDSWKPKVVLMGDHVTAHPEESMKNAKVDFIITGGNYDFLLLNLCNCLAKNNYGLYIKNNLSLESGIWYRKNNEIKNTGKYTLNHDLNDLPYIDRELTQWKLYSQKNGNFKYTPGTYVMAGRDCWWGKCDFCSWTTLFPGKNYRTVSVNRHLDEIGYLIENLKVKEIFDDSGCFPKGEWLEDFLKGIIERGYHKKVVFGCNMRIGALTQEQFNLMKKANFRFILIGLESVNQKTLDKLTKGIKVDQIKQTCQMAKKAGLEPHITVMTGYPWETKKDTIETVALAKEMFKKGWIDTLQATIVVPYPGTPLFDEAKKNGWLITQDWDRYDMKESVWKSSVSSDDILELTKELYKAALSPSFIIRKVLSIRNLDDIKFLIRAGLKVLGHLTDFSNKYSIKGTN